MQGALKDPRTRIRLTPRRAVGILTAAGAALRLIYISQPMRYDEAATYLYYSSKSALYALVSYTYPNNHVFHTLLVSVSTFFFGDHPWAIRLPAFLAGVAVIPLTYLVGRRYSEAIGALGAAFVASSSVLIEFSTNARGYTLVGAIFLALLALMPAMLRGEQRAWKWFAFLAAIGFFTIPTMLFPFGIVVASLAASIARAPRPDRDGLFARLARAVLLTGMLVLAGYLPAILWTGPREVFANRFVTPQTWTSFAHTIGGSLGATWLGWNRALGTAAAITFAVFFAIGVAKERMTTPIFIVLWCGGLLLVGRWVPFHRVWTFLIPVYWIGVAAGIAAIVRREKVILPVALAVCLAIGGSVIASGSVLRSTETGAFPDAQRVASSLRLSGDHDQVIASRRTDAPLLYYARLDREQLVVDTQGPSRGGRVFVVVDTAAGESLDQLAIRYGTPALPASVIQRATLFRAFKGARVYVAN